MHILFLKPQYNYIYINDLGHYYRILGVAKITAFRGTEPVSIICNAKDSNIKNCIEGNGFFLINTKEPIVTLQVGPDENYKIQNLLYII